MAHNFKSAMFAGLLIGSSTIGATAASAQDYPNPPQQPQYDQSAPGEQSDPRYDPNNDPRNDPRNDARNDPRGAQSYQDSSFGESGYQGPGDQGPGDQGGPPPPPNYDGSQLPPPPPGYADDPAYRSDSTQDHRYQAYAEDWSERYCVKARNNTGTGAVIGGLFGALLGSGLSGRHDHGSGALIGGLAGAAGGAVIGSASSNATSPGCPPGFVAERDAPAFAFADEGQPYYYAAPAWYRPWYFNDGRWAYRPYPYHVYYYRTYGYGGYGRGGYGRGGYGGGYGGGGYGRGHGRPGHY